MDGFERDEGLSLGGTLPLYKAFSEMSRLAGESWESEYPDLSGVVSQIEDGDDASPEWLEAVKEQAVRFKAKYGDKIDGYTSGLLDVLAGKGDGLGESPVRGRNGLEAPRMRES